LLALDAAHFKQLDVEYRYETLRKYYEKQKLERQEYEVIQTLISYGQNNPQAYHTLLRFIFTHNSAKYIVDLDTIAMRAQRYIFHDNESATLPQLRKEKMLFDWCEVYQNYVFFFQSASRLDSIGQLFIQRYPQFPQGYELVAYERLKAGAWNDVVELSQTALRIDSLRVHARIFLGRVYYRRNDFPQALAMYEKAIAIDPNPVFKTAFADLGYLYMNYRRDGQKAILMFETYLMFDRSSPTARGIVQELTRLKTMP
jgi:tetratricopeptide (TPR) repeat protein